KLGRVEQGGLGRDVVGHDATVINERHGAEDTAENAAVDMHERQDTMDPVLANRRQAGRLVAKLVSIDPAPTVQMIEGPPGVAGKKPVPPGGLAVVDHMNLHVREAFSSASASGMPASLG